MTPAKSYSLFEVSGIEIEYMIVDRNTLRVKPVADLLLSAASGNGTSDYINGNIGWSNELVNHVIELKTAQPVRDLSKTAGEFARNIRKINAILEKNNAMLLPTAMHPFMDPRSETVLWQHGSKEIYALYDRIFDCRKHGWANLQSVHLNLPFNGDEEFGRLHAAIRILLPIIPAIAASSPLRDGKISGWLDSRMEAYLINQQKLPSLMGSLIPEPVFTKEEYHNRIFDPIRQEITPWDTDGIMDHHFLNSRGAIARFDRGSIEIRVTDTQECPSADIAIFALITEVLKSMVNEKYAGFDQQVLADEAQLFRIFRKAIKQGAQTEIDSPEYLSLFGINQKKISVKEIWQQLYESVENLMNPVETSIIDYILNHGSLAERLLKRFKDEPTNQQITSVYRELAVCLEKNTLL